jgi:competence protein ComEC
VILCCLIFLFSVSLLKNSQILPQNHIVKIASHRNNCLYTIKGFVDSQPLYKNNKTSFIFKAQEIQFANVKYRTCGNVLVYIKDKKDLDYGEELILRGSLYRPFGFNSTNRESYRDYLYAQGIFSIMNIRTGSLVVRLNQNRGWMFKRLALWLKEKMEEIIFQRVSGAAASILDAMVLGEKRKIPPIIYNSMIKSGTVHILVVSGFNVGIVISLVILSLKLIRIPRRIRFYIATPSIIIYCLITGASNPVVRATVMAIVFIFAYLVQREPDIYNSSALAALFILSINPRQLFDIGFQLSFASVIAIVYFYPKMRTFLHPAAFKIKYIKFLIEACLVSFSAWLGTLGLVAHYFKIISPITVLANMFIVPLAAIITLCGFSMIAIQFLCPVLASFFAYSAEFAVTLLLRINTFLIKLPHAYFYLS